MIAVYKFTADATLDIPLENTNKYCVDLVLGENHMTTKSNNDDVDAIGTINFMDTRSVAIDNSDVNTRLEVRLKKEG